jgi:methionyl-tRNA formyltransferase
VFARIAAGDPGDAQSTEGVTWAGHFGEDYATVDWAQPARRIHDQVRAWAFTFGLSPVVGPIAEVDGQRVRLVRTSLTDPGGEAKRVETGDGPLWVVEMEPLESS